MESRYFRVEYDPQAREYLIILVFCGGEEIKTDIGAPFRHKAVEKAKSLEEWLSSYNPIY